MMKKVIELEGDVPTVTTSITEEHQRQHVMQKQPVKSYPLSYRKSDEKIINCKQGASSSISVQIRRSNYEQDIRKSRILIPTWQKKLRKNCQPKKFPAKPVGLFSKVTFPRTDNAKTEEKKYEINDDDGNINFIGKHQLDDTEDINRTNINDSDGRSILKNQDGGQYQVQHTARSWAYFNQTCALLLPGSAVYNFPSFSELQQVFVLTNAYWVHCYLPM